MSVTYILARTLGDAHAFAKDQLGLSRGEYRVVNSAAGIKAVRGGDLHLVPGYESRFDKFAMNVALKWTRLNKVDHTQDEAPAEVPVDQTPTVDQNVFFDLFVSTTPEPATEQAEAPVEPAEPEVKRRRRRCNDCGTMHYKTDPCVQTEPLEGV